MPQPSLTPFTTIQAPRPRPGFAERSDAAAPLSLLLFRELQHRTENILNTASVLLEVQARRATHPDPRKAFEEIAATFRALIEANRAFSVPDTDAVADAATEIRAAVMTLSNGYATTRPEIRFDSSIADTPKYLVRPAGMLALIVNELVTNAFKHAFRGRATGFLLVTLAPADHGRACLSVIDDGPGVATTGPTSGRGLGIVGALAKAIGGEVSFSGGGRQENLLRVTFEPCRDGH